MGGRSMSDKNTSSPAAEKRLAPGTRAFSVFLLVFAGYFFFESVQIYQEYPSFSGPGFFPLCVSGLMICLVIADFIGKLKIKSAEVHGGFVQRVVATWLYVFPKDSFIFLLMSIAYYLLLLAGVPFLPASVIFLISSMCYMIRNSILKNIIYTVVLMAAIYAIFVLVFKVSLP